VVPEAVQDRFTNDFEKIYFFTKNEKYFFEKQYEAFAEKTLTAFKDGIMPTGKKKMLGAGENRTGMREVNKPWKVAYNEKGRNMRTVWKIATKGISEAHFATSPEKLVRRCILAGCPESGIVLDPFLGSGTTLKVAKQLNRSGIGIELNQEYIQIAKKRIGNDLFNEVQIK
jgi:DNA methylase N-4/N-6 domain-containing protein